MGPLKTRTTDPLSDTATSSVPSAPAATFSSDTKLEKPPYEEERYESHGAVTIGGACIEYTAVAGTIMVEAKNNEPAALMSYVAYFKRDSGPTTRRPLTFFYNGGPGSATLWLHMGLGPKRVIVGDGVRGPSAPYEMVENEYSPLDATDMVFIDAPGTGFGRVGQDEKNLPIEGDKAKNIRAHNEELKKEFYGVDQDARAFSIFIAKFLSKFERWNSPKFLFGESYGAARSALLAYLLAENSKIDLNGLMQLSQILTSASSVDRAVNNPANDIAFALALPSYAATAWYHKKIPASSKELEPFLQEVEKFALGEYAAALSVGDELGADERHTIAEKMHSYIGLPVDFIEKANLRIYSGMFAKTLLESRGLLVGYLDSRYTGPSLDILMSMTPDRSTEIAYDPLRAAISSAYVSVYNDYARTTLGFSKEVTYAPSGPVRTYWDRAHKLPGQDFPSRGQLNVMPDLAAAMRLNPKLKVVLYSGYFDIATLFFAARYEMNHLGLPPELHKNISFRNFKSGHMVYVTQDALRDLHEDMVRFINSNALSEAR